MQLRLKFLSLTLFVACLTLEMGGQQRRGILEEQWKVLKTQLERRNKVISQILMEVKSLRFDNNLTEKINYQVKEFNKIITLHKNFDSTLVIPLSHQSDTLETLLPDLSKMINNTSELSKSKSIRALLIKLDSLENRLPMDKQNYNDLCEDKPHLWFQLKKDKHPVRQPM